MAKQGRACRYRQWVEVFYEVGFGARTIDIICPDDRWGDLISSANVGDELTLELASGRELILVVKDVEDVEPTVCRTAIKDQRFKFQHWP